MPVQDRAVLLGWLGALLVSTIGDGPPVLAADSPPRPNIVYVLADDLGYGDVRAFNANSKIAMPRLDRLASQGRIFTDAHSGSAVCTPTRYGILTGRYAWRTRLKQGVLGGYSPPLIEPGRITVASLLKQHGYATACFGKWHLGLEWPTRSSQRFGDSIEPLGDISQVDYTQPIRSGPTTLGFDRFFGISASLDMPPYVFIRDDRCVSVPATRKTYIREGPAAHDFEAVAVLPELTAHAVAFLDAQGSGHKPFFLYVPLSAPHTPIVPSTAYAGKSGLGAYADFVTQVDSAVGVILDALARNGLESKTLVVVTSDNGCSPMADFKSLAAHGHDPSAPWRGAKADIFEGGHRIPFIARWPGKVPAGTRSDDTICLTDLLATCAALTGATVPDGAGGGQRQPATRLARWRLQIAPRGNDPPLDQWIIRNPAGTVEARALHDSGGWSDPKPGSPEAKELPPVQLYNLIDDPGERHNLHAERPQIAERLSQLLKRYVREGRSVARPSGAHVP